MSERITDAELARWLVRSYDRMIVMLRDRMEDKDTQGKAWLEFAERLLSDAQRRGILPVVPITANTPLGEKSGAM